MKLHFYFMEEMGRGAPFIRYCTAEAEEKPKTYILKEKPCGIYVSRISKDNIGKLSVGYANKKIILKERDDEKAKLIFSDYYISEIKRLEKGVSDNKSKLKIVSEWRNKA